MIYANVGVKPTGQMQEDTQELLDFYNRHYNWEYNDMCRFIDNQELRHINEKVSILIHQLDDYREERLAEKEVTK